jgi:hypothetical protein
MTKRQFLGMLFTGGFVFLSGPSLVLTQTRTETGRLAEKNSPASIKTYRGTIVRVDGDRLYVSLGRGRRVIIRVPDDTKISLDHRPAEPEDLKAGMRLRVYAAPRVRVTGPTGDRGDAKVTGSKDTSRSGVRGEGGVISRSAFKGVTAVNWVAIRIEARSAGRSRKK